MSEVGKPHKRYSVATGRKRHLTFKLMGWSYGFTAVEHVEMISLATGKRIDATRWAQGGSGNFRVLHGATSRYYEIRDDLGERIRHYDGLVLIRPIS